MQTLKIGNKTLTLGQVFENQNPKDPEGIYRNIVIFLNDGTIVTSDKADAFYYLRPRIYAWAWYNLTKTV